MIHGRHVLVIYALLGTAPVLAAPQEGSAGAGLNGSEVGSVVIPATRTAAVLPGVRQAAAPKCTSLVPTDVVKGARLREDTCYRVQGALAVTSGTLVVEPGVHVAFEPTGHLTIATGGSLSALGTAAKPIVFTSADAAGRWRGIRFSASRSADNILHHVTIENGGSTGWSGAAHSTSALLLEGNTLVDIQHSTIAGSGGQGVTATSGAAMTFEHNTLRANAVAAWVHPNSAGSVGSTTRFDANAGNVVRVVFGNTDAVTTAQTWHALGVPFEIQDRMGIDAPLTLAPGAVLAFKADTSAIVRTGGSLTAAGTTTAPITFTSVENLDNYWKGLQIATASAGNRFDHVIFENGGSQPWSGLPDSRAMVYLDGNSRAAFTNSTFRGSGHYGLWVPSGGDITGFDRNVFTRNRRAMIVHPNRAGAIAANNAFADNAENKVRVSFGNTDAVTTAQTWHDFNAPFYVTTRTFVGATLTIAAGTEVEFAQDASLVVRPDGALRADGTAGSPVVFRGGEDLAGYWQGIEYGSVSAGNALAHVLLSNAGSRPWFGGPNSTATLHVAPKGLVALTNVAFEQSGGYAVIVRPGGRLTCSAVNRGEFQFYASAPGTAMPGCP